MNNSIYNFLGLMKKANKLSLGTNMVLDDIRNNKVFLVIVTKDLLLNTKKTLTDKTSFYNVPILFDFDQELLNKSIGKSMIKVIGIKDKNAASKIISMQKV